MVEGPSAGLEAIDEVAGDGQLHRFHYLHAARADFLRRMARTDQAAQAYRQALELVTNGAEQEFLERRPEEVAPTGR
jgi:RNA polymerase sigma-70 factor (ECF subfamily)